MKTSLTIATLLSLTLTGAACKKKDDDAGGGSAKAGEAGKGGGGKAAPAPKLEWKRLGALGLEAEVPAGTEIDDNTAGAGFPAATLWASPTTFVHGAGELSPIKPDVDGAKAELQKDPNPFKAFTKEETTADGWRLEYELASMLDGKPIYGVQLRRTIDGVAWDCGSNTSSPAERDQVAAICASLRKAAN